MVPRACNTRFLKFVPRILSIKLHVKTVHILPLAEHALKIRSSYAQCAMKSFPRMLNQNFEKPFRKPSYRTQVSFLINKLFLDISPKKFGSAYAQSPRKCSNFEILAKIDGKEAKFFSKLYQEYMRI
jgi:hypothetical protein